MTTTEGVQMGMSLERLGRIDGWAQGYIDQGRISGAQVLVSRGGETVYHRGFGLADRERERPTSEDTVYRIYSMTKPITSVALMMLWEEARLRLTHPVAHFIPEWQGLRVREAGATRTSRRASRRGRCRCATC
jgi:CubicO group peptidase (beta-lactamase class C family)